LDGNILTFDLGAMQSLFPTARIFFSPKFYQTRVLTKASLGTNRSKRPKWTEKIKELKVGVIRRKVLHETWRRAWGWKGRGGCGWGIRREHKNDGW